MNGQKKNSNVKGRLLKQRLAVVQQNCVLNYLEFSWTFIWTFLLVKSIKIKATKSWQWKDIYLWDQPSYREYRKKAHCLRKTTVWVNLV